MEKTAIKKHALRPQEVAETLSTSVRTLARWRARGHGPNWFKVGRAVFYPTKEIDAWLRRNTQY